MKFPEGKKQTLIDPVLATLRKAQPRLELTEAGAEVSVMMSRCSLVAAAHIRVAPASEVCHSYSYVISWKRSNLLTITLSWFSIASFGVVRVAFAPLPIIS